MKLAFSSLKEHLETQASALEICEKLTAIGLEVESFSDLGKNLESFTVAKILEATPHENSTKLKICQVQTIDSQTPLQIICGAANARAGIKVAYAKIGSVIPANGIVIKKAKIAGTESSGMLCSTSELGLKGDDAGIIEIDDAIEIGAKISDVFNINEKIIEINVTPNRGDCLGVYGVARDLAASGIGQLKKFEIPQTKSAFEFPLQLENQALQACPYAAFRYIKNVKNHASPQWLKDKLEAVGMNSISAIVDVTNYVMHILNRPMHAYDASKIEGALNIRFAQNGEKFTSLKNDEYILDEKILVISDSKKAVGIAGVIGGANSSCNGETSDIILESAFFSSNNISYAGRKLNILSDARHRFERGIDDHSCLAGIELATKLILEICGGEPSEIKEVGQKSIHKKVKFDSKKIEKLIGIIIAENEIRKILTALEFQVDEAWNIAIPTHRHDIATSEDLVEEVVRIFGYDKIIPKQLVSEKVEANNNIFDAARLYLASQGMVETISWSFVDAKLVELFDEKKEQLLLANPISSEMDHMRSSLAIGLMQSYKKNYLRGVFDNSIFEIGNVFAVDASNNIIQKKNVSGLRAGKNQAPSHYKNERDFDVFDVKKDIVALIENFGLRFENLQISSENPPKYYHPYRFASLKLGKNIIGYFGEINPVITKKFDIKNRINIFELFTDNLPNAQKSGLKKAFIANDFPVVERDFAFLVDKNLAIGDLIKSVTNIDKNLIKEVSIFDIFAGKNIEEGKKSVALRVKMQHQEKTMSSEEIDAISNKLIDAVAKSFSATLRK